MREIVLSTPCVVLRLRHVLPTWSCFQANEPWTFSLYSKAVFQPSECPIDCPVLHSLFLLYNTPALFTLRCGDQSCIWNSKGGCHIDLYGDNTTLVTFFLFTFRWHRIQHFHWISPLRSLYLVRHDSSDTINLDFSSNMAHFLYINIGQSIHPVWRFPFCKTRSCSLCRIHFK